MMRKICSATLINVGVGKKIQKLYVLVVKARGGVKSAPAITLDFWLRLKKKNTRWSSPVSKGGGSGIDFFLSVRPFLFLMNSMLSFSIVLLINCLLSLSPCLSLCVARVFELIRCYFLS